MTLELVRVGVALAVAFAAAVIDARRGIIPDRLSLAATAAGIGLGIADGQLISHLAAGGACALVLVGMRLTGTIFLGQPGMGWGDVKLGGVLGVLLGWNALWGLYLAVVCGAVIGGVGLLLGRIDRLHRMPFAPFIASGVALAQVMPLPYWIERSLG